MGKFIKNHNTEVRIGLFKNYRFKTFYPILLLGFSPTNPLKLQLCTELILLAFNLFQLVHCVSCCEAYHQYCVEMNMHPSKLSLDRNWWRVDWICPKCTFCTVCNDPAPQLCCQRCLKSYHSNCLSPNRQRPHLTDKTWVCIYFLVFK